MTRVECEFEADVLAAAVQSRWPDRVDERLRAHVADCEICRDVAVVAGALDAARDQMRSTIVIPDSARVWWVAQMRARREAAKAAVRPITAVQVIAFSCAVATLGACFGATSTWFQSALTVLVAGVKDAAKAMDWRALAALIAAHGAIATTMILVLVLVPAAVYLAVGRD